VVAQCDQLLFGELVDPQVRTDTGGGESLQGAGTSDPEDVGECDLHALVAWQVNTNEACHGWLPFSHVVGVGACSVPAWRAGAPANDPEVDPLPPCPGDRCAVTLWSPRPRCVQLLWPWCRLRRPYGPVMLSPDAACGAGCRKSPEPDRVD